MSNQQNQPPAGPEQQQSRGGNRLAPFTVEFGDDFGRNPMINTPPIQSKVRGTFSIPRMASRKEHPRADFGTTASKIPELPGQHLSVDPGRKRARLFDPLEEGKGKEVLDRYNTVAKATFGLQEFAPVPAVEYNNLDDHQLKSLLLEIKRKLDHGTCRLVDGQFPSDREIEALQGRELNDPWNQGRKPKFKDEVEAWQQSPAFNV